MGRDIIRLGGGIMNRKTTSHLGLLGKHNLALLALSLVLSPKFMSGQTLAGTLDPSFGSGGRVTTFFGGDGLNGDDLGRKRESSYGDRDKENLQRGKLQIQ
jgi:hypothetical protein